MHGSWLEGRTGALSRRGCNEDRSYPLQLALRQIEGRQPGPHVLITGGVHGDEFEPMAAIRRLIHRLRPEGLRGVLLASS